MSCISFLRPFLVLLLFLLTFHWLSSANELTSAYPNELELAFKIRDDGARVIDSTVGKYSEILFFLCVSASCIF